MKMCSFALESGMEEEIHKGNIPYAVHAWEKCFSAEELIGFVVN